MSQLSSVAAMQLRFGKSTLISWGRVGEKTTDWEPRVQLAIDDAEEDVIGALRSKYSIPAEYAENRTVSRLIELKAALILQAPRAANQEDAAFDSYAEEFDQLMGSVLSPGYQLTGYSQYASVPSAS